VGALLLLAWSPYTLLDAGFQLSFAAVAAIFVVVPRAQRFLEGYPVPTKLADVVAISFACGVVTAPILVLQFGRIPLYSVPANALAAPVVAPLLALSFAAALANPVSPPAAAMIASVNGWLAAYLAWCARFVAGLPGAVVSSAAGIGALLLVSSSLVLAVRLCAEPRPRRA
jgi:competence protein ComEC